jgi:sugar lactone lactonase YvrE
MNVTLTPYAPSVFTYQRASGVFDPIIVHSADNQLVTPTDLAVPGEYLVVYGTGIGDLTVVPATDAFSPASPPAAAKLTPTATIGGVNAPVSFAGLTPGGIGLAQFNIRVPNNLPSGSTLPLVINFNGAASYPVNLAVKNSVRTPVISTVAAGKGGLALDASGNIYTVSTGNTVRKTAPDGTSSLVAGNGSAGNGGDGGLAVNAQLNSPNAVALDGTNNLYISDYANGRVRVVTPDGRITAFAGNGQYGSGGDGGPASQAQFAELRNLAADQAGDVFIVTALTVRRVGVDGIIRAVAGNPSCYGNYSGDGGPAVNACLYVVAQVALDSKGFLYIADAFNNRVRRVDPTTGVITTFAGNGSSGFSGDGGLATQAQLSGPFGVAVDPAGNVYISDDGNSRVRKVTLDGMITTVVGTGVRGFSGDGGPPGTAQLNGPEDLAFDQAGNLYVFDSGNGLIRKVILP